MEQRLDATIGKILKKICDKRFAIASVGHAATEMVLTRLCADVGTLVYQLRLNGDQIDSDLLARHDHALRASLDSVL